MSFDEWGVASLRAQYGGLADEAATPPGASSDGRDEPCLASVSQSGCDDGGVGDEGHDLHLDRSVSRTAAVQAGSTRKFVFHARRMTTVRRREES